jgi:hypothetical protein
MPQDACGMTRTLRGCSRPSWEGLPIPAVARSQRSVKHGFKCGPPIGCDVSRHRAHVSRDIVPRLPPPQRLVVPARVESQLRSSSPSCVGTSVPPTRRPEGQVIRSWTGRSSGKNPMGSTTITRGWSRFGCGSLVRGSPSRKMRRSLGMTRGMPTIMSWAAWTLTQTGSLGLRGMKRREPTTLTASEARARSLHQTLHQTTRSLRFPVIRYCPRETPAIPDLDDESR